MRARLLAAFPTESRVPRSESYRPGVVLGQDYLRQAYVVCYQVRGVNFELYLIGEDGQNQEQASQERKDGPQCSFLRSGFIFCLSSCIRLQTGRNSRHRRRHTC